MKIFRLFAVASAAFFIATAAIAQQPGTVTNHAFMIGRGAGQTGFASLLCASTELAIGQSAANPACHALSGDVTMDASGVTAIGSSKVTNTMLAGSIVLSKLATQAAYSLVGNATGSSAVPTAFTIGGLTQKVSPASTDYILIQDQAASGALKYAQVSAVAAAGSVGSLNGLTGSLTWSVTKQVFTSSGTYTPTTGMKYAIIECVGGGGGGGGAAGASGAQYAGGGGGAGGYSRVVVSAATVGASKTVTIGAKGAGGTAGANNGSAGSDTSVGTLCVGKGGSGGLYGSNLQNAKGGAGGVAGTGDITTVGGPGMPGVYATIVTFDGFSGTGGSSHFGGGAVGVDVAGTTGTNASANAYGAGGSGGMRYNTAANSAGGDGADGVVFITEYLIN